MIARIMLGAMLLALSGLSAAAAQPLKRIDAHVLPYYQAAPSADEKPVIAVARDVDDLLSSNDPKDIAAAEQKIRQDPQLISPMALMALAIRLYDTGRRDDAVFWFYVANDRYDTLIAVLDKDSSPLSPFNHAMKAFDAVAAPIITGYAYCNIPAQQRQRSAALDWVERHPYQLVFAPRMTALPGNRNANLQRAVTRLRVRAAAERTGLEQPDRLEQFQRQRRIDQADAKYCWH